MRIAVAGSHATGKSTLVSALAARRPSRLTIDEAFTDLFPRGAGSAGLSVDTFEPQLVRSLELMHRYDQSDAIFDRSPVDYLAYLRILEPSWDVGTWFPRVREALASIDLTVYVPIESPDRIPVSAEEHPRLRQRVDRLLREVLLDDGWGLGLVCCEVTGTVEQRVAQIEGCCDRLTLHRSAP